MEPGDADALLYFNGIDVATGGYGQAPMSEAQLAALVTGQPLPDNRDDLRQRVKRDEQDREKHFGVKAGVDATDLAQAGWGVVFAHGEDPAVREALRPLLDLRRAQATRTDERRYRELWGPAAYRPKEGEKKAGFLRRSGAAPWGPADPDLMPYYLLLVGSPERIPYVFQYELDVQYAVGRLWFPTVEQYAH
ncbi:MAG: hypothetical protein KDK70_18460, partial [Myxococcales bacterium]|nr:hypothetical protein [Myxococcales bacterium]